MFCRIETAAFFASILVTSQSCHRFSVPGNNELRFNVQCAFRFRPLLTKITNRNSLHSSRSLTCFTKAATDFTRLTIWERANDGTVAATYWTKCIKAEICIRQNHGFRSVRVSRGNIRSPFGVWGSQFAVDSSVKDER